MMFIKCDYRNGSFNLNVKVERLEKIKHIS